MRPITAILFHIFLFVVVMALSSGCSKTQYIPVESIRTDSVFVYRNVASAITIKDSIYIDRTKDTVKVTQYKYVGERFTSTDTIYINKSDTIRLPYPVERKLSRWEQAKIDYGGFALLAVLVAVIVYFGLKRYKILR